MTTNIVEYVATLASHALAAPASSKLTPNRPPAYHAQFAFAPEAFRAIAAIAQVAVGTEPLSKYQVSCRKNGEQQRPLPGIPDDWYVLRASSQYATQCYDQYGQRHEQTDANGVAMIERIFYPGARVRADISAYAWTFGGRRGVSFNLSGIMATGEEAERLNIGTPNSSRVFARYAQKRDERDDRGRERVPDGRRSAPDGHDRAFDDRAFDDRDRGRAFDDARFDDHGDSFGVQGLDDEPSPFDNTF